MAAFASLLGVLFGAVLLRALAGRIGAPYPALLALGGAAVALSPLQLPLASEPELMLALFVAPVLLDAAYDASLRDLKDSWQSILLLAVVPVALTTLAVAAIAHALVPGLPWAAAVALGAIVGPPDAAAAVAVLRGVGLPHRLLVILEGESLFNDATALLIYRLAVTAMLAGGGLDLASDGPAVALAIVGGLAAGPALAWAWHKLIVRFEDAPAAIVLQFTGAFGVWLVADALGLSPILVTVTFAITTAQFAPARTPARLRIPAYAVWETAVVVLNALAFVLIGLQLGSVVKATPAGTLGDWASFATAVLAVVIAVRLGWAMFANLVIRTTGWFAPTPRDGEMTPSWQGGLLIGWSGMRGIVTVATALALPDRFPEHDRLLFAAFAVALGTLVIQGMTLAPLVRRFGLRDGGPVEREVRAARVAMADASLQAIEGDASREADALREELQLERRTADEAEEGDGRPHLPAKALRARVLTLRRERLLQLRREREIGDDAFHQLEEELDLAELAVANRA